MTINVLQLCAGKGSRFAGYSPNPKPFIGVNGNPMFKVAFDSMQLTNIRQHYLFQEAHIEHYNPSQYLNDEATIHSIDGYTDGAATSASYVISQSEYKDEPWIILDCDFILDYDVNKFLETTNSCSVVLIEEHPYDIKSSYSCVDSDMNVYGVAEKQVISRYRNTGQYHFESGILFEEAYRFYKDNNILALGELYIAPLYNYIIQNGHKVKGCPVNKFTSLGTPDALEKYLND